MAMRTDRAVMAGSISGQEFAARVGCSPNMSNIMSAKSQLESVSPGATGQLDMSRSVHV